MNEFREGDKVYISQWWVDKYHPNDSRFKGDFEVNYPAFNGAACLFLKVSDDYVAIFQRNGKYLFSDKEPALLAAHP